MKTLTNPLLSPPLPPHKKEERATREKAGSQEARGAVLIFTLFMIFLASFALTLFIERAGSEIQTDAHLMERPDLRAETYSALEITLGVLDDIMHIEGSLYAPRQGWQDPFTYAGIRSENRDVQIRFIDETGKIPLEGIPPDVLIRLFEGMGYDFSDAEDLAEALLSWTDANYERGRLGGDGRFYEGGELPYRESGRPLRSFYELVAVEGFREHFFDEDGLPNRDFFRFQEQVSLNPFPRVNLNSASAEVLQAWGNLPREDAEAIVRYRESPSPEYDPYFKSVQEATTRLALPLDNARFTAVVQSLRIEIENRRGDHAYTLSARIFTTPPGNSQGGGNNTPVRQRPQVVRETGADGQERTSLRMSSQASTTFPFTILEIRENQSLSQARRSPNNEP
ncbi:MAG: type II secretion system protein GspK [Opitutales bacterium]